MTVADLILTIPYFEDLPLGDAEALAAHCRVITADTGEFIFRAGEPAEGLYYLVRGRARATRYSPKGRELTVREFAPGDTFNEVGALNPGDNPSSCIADVAGTDILLIPRHALLPVLKKHPAVNYKIMQSMADKLQYALGKMDEFAFLDVKSRLALLLLDVAENTGVLTNISQERLAARIGTVRQVLGRALTEFQHEGAVHVTRGRITVLAPDLLRRHVRHQS